MSRTVVREAVAAPRADGLVVTRPGSGAYVADNPTEPFPMTQLGRLSDVLDVMELRLAVEVEAAGNAQFPRFLVFLGSRVIPRPSMRLSMGTPAGRRAHLERIQHEHHRIVAGIAHADSSEARRAMRDHLTRSLERYRKLAEGWKS